MDEIPDDAQLSISHDPSPEEHAETSDGQVVVVSPYLEGREVVLQIGVAPDAKSARLSPDEARRIGQLLSDAADEFLSD